MIRARLFALLVAGLAISTACDETTDPSPPQANATGAPELSLDGTSEEAESYLGALSSRLVQRPLVSSELQQIQSEGVNAIVPIVESWLQSPKFGKAVRDMMEHLLKTNGKHDDVDFDLPGNLAEHIVSEEHPYSFLLTADYCVDEFGAKIECDTSAPYVAGVLTTRAYLSANASRFNLRRASTLMNVFSCRGYPMEFGLQPSADKESLIPMFQAQTPEEQTVEEAQNGFGNGFGCYTCHSQFANHAQLYVKFDSTGLWRSHAHGIQDEYGELGRSIGRYFASHFAELDRSENETAQVFGQEVPNLAGAAQVIVAEPQFLSCAVRRTFEYAFNLDETLSARTDVNLYRNIAEALKRDGKEDATFQDLFRYVVTEPKVFRSYIEQR